MEHRVLRDHVEGRAGAREAEFANLLSVDEDGTRIGLDDAEEGEDERRLACGRSEVGTRVVSGERGVRWEGDTRKSDVLPAPVRPTMAVLALGVSAAEKLTIVSGSPGR